MPSLNGINQVILLPWAKVLSCTMPTLHNGPKLSHHNCPFCGGCRYGRCRSMVLKANCRALQIGILIQSSCLCTAHECDRQTRRTDIPVAVLKLRLLGWEASAIFSPNSCWIFQRWLEGVDRVRLSASMTSCDKWFQFCSTRWLKKITFTA